MGHFVAGDRVFVGLCRAVGDLAATRKGITGLACCALFAQAAAFQIDGDVGRREAYQRRRFLGLAWSLVSLERAHGARLSLLVTTAADCLCLVDGQKPGMVQAFLGRVLPDS